MVRNAAVKKDDIRKEAVMEVMAGQSKISFSRPNDSTMVVQLTGTWKIGQDLPLAATVKQRVETWPEIKQIAFNTKALADWDSSLVTFLMKIIYGSPCTVYQTGFHYPLKRKETIIYGLHSGESG
jgi:hypothetical protein